MRTLLRIASRRATDAEIGDVIEEYDRDAHSRAWFVSQLVSIARRRRSPLTIPERGAEMLSSLAGDIRYALRTLARNPGFAVAAIVPIALGVGINTGIFAILNSVAWRPLPVQDGDALVSVHHESRGGPRRRVYGARSLFSLPEYQTYRDGSQALAGLMAFSHNWTVTMGRTSPMEIEGTLVTCDYFEVLRVRPHLGTGFTPTNCGSPELPATVVLSHALWQSAFGGDPQIVNKSIVLNGRDVTVVGVGPAGFDGVGMAKVALFASTSMASEFSPEQNLATNPHVSWLTMIGRRHDHTDIGQVRADLALIARRIDDEQAGRLTSLVVEPASALSLPVQRREILRGAGVVLGAFGIVLLIATANVANILLARAATRSRELAIRLSVGATRGRLVRQLLTESAIIAALGGACGMLLFAWLFETLIPWLLSLIPGADAMRIDATLDVRVLWFAFALIASTALLSGLFPALQASGARVYAVTKQDSTGSSGRGWARGMLIGAQVTLCTTLLIPAGLLCRALYAAQTMDPGFEYDNVAVVSVNLRGPRYEKDGAAVFYREWLERLRALPGVEGLSVASRVPLSPGRSQTTFRLADASTAYVVDVNTVSPEFFATVGLPIVRGRVFTDGEAEVALATESTARRYWPGQDAVGQIITMDDRPRQIVGIVRDADVSQVASALSSYLYLPAKTSALRGGSALVRTQVDLAGFAAAARAEAARMDASLVVNVQPLSNNLRILQMLSRIAAGVAGTLTMLAVALAGIGVYGVVAYIVSRRRREVGVRMALGADADDVRRLIMRQTMRPIVVGVVIGIAGAAATARVFQSVLFGVSPYDPVAFVAAPALMVAIAAAAAFVPTRQAMQVDPISVLRSE
jgi:predicted permease